MNEWGISTGRDSQMNRPNFIRFNRRRIEVMSRKITAHKAYTRARHHRHCRHGNKLSPSSLRHRLITGGLSFGFRDAYGYCWRWWKVWNKKKKKKQRKERKKEWKKRECCAWKERINIEGEKTDRRVLLRTQTRKWEEYNNIGSEKNKIKKKR